MNASVRRREGGGEKGLCETLSVQLSVGGQLRASSPARPSRRGHPPVKPNEGAENGNERFEGDETLDDGRPPTSPFPRHGLPRACPSSCLMLSFSSLICSTVALIPSSHDSYDPLPPQNSFLRSHASSSLDSLLSLSVAFKT